MNIKGISIVVPVYNSSKSLHLLVEKILESMKDQFDFELILINDGSPDNSWEVIKTLSTENSFIKGINLKRNYGQHNAILCGIRSASKEIIITMDDDLQHPPEEISKLINKLSEGYDVVYGVPKKLPHSFWRNIASRLSKKVLSVVMGVRTIKDIGSFRAFYTHLRDAFPDFRNPGVIVDVLLSWGTSKFTHIEVEEKPRQYGQSNYSFTALLKQVFLILTGFSTIPLRFASWLGFFFTIFGFGIFIYVLIITFGLGSIPGFPFLASIISIFSGIQLFALGIFGEYLARIFDRSMEQPTYVIGEIIQKEDEIK